jgi:hypothetical protein
MAFIQRVDEQGTFTKNDIKLKNECGKIFALKSKISTFIWFFEWPKRICYFANVFLRERDKAFTEDSNLAEEMMEQLLEANNER